MYTLSFVLKSNSIKIEDLLFFLPDNLPFEPEWFSSADIAPEGDWFTEKTFTKLENEKVKQFSIFDKQDAEESKAIFHFIDDEKRDMLYITWDADNADFLKSNFFDYLLNEQGFISCHIYQFLDVSYQSEIYSTHLKYAPSEYKHFKMITDKDGQQIIDTSQNYGRMNIIKNLVFLAAPMMWYGKEFYKYISKERFLSFKNANKITELKNDVIFIELFDYKESPLIFQNRNKQQQFREWVGMDELEKKLQDIIDKNSDGSSATITTYFGFD